MHNGVDPHQMTRTLEHSLPLKNGLAMKRKERLKFIKQCSYSTPWSTGKTTQKMVSYKFATVSED